MVSLIKLGVKFKPAKYIISLLQEGRVLANKNFGVTKAEVTHCVFNDLRVVKDHRDVGETAKIILKNRDSHIDYDSRGDVVRYAGDILDYMVLANILVYRPNGLYYLKTHEPEMLMSFVNCFDYFNGYDDFYNNDNLTPQMVSERAIDWFNYVNENIDKKYFKQTLQICLTVKTLKFTALTLTLKMNVMRQPITKLWKV